MYGVHYMEAAIFEGTLTWRSLGEGAMLSMHKLSAGARRECGALLFCIGLILLPALLATDTAIWLGCRNLSRADCVDLFVLSIAQAESDFRIPSAESP